MTAPAAQPTQPQQPPPPPPPQGHPVADIAAAYLIYQLITSHSAQNQSLLASLLSGVGSAWQAFLASPRGAGDVEAYLGKVVPLAQGSQHVAASMTDSYLSRAVGEMTGTPARPGASGFDTRAATTEATRGLAPEVVYRRPITQFYVERAKGKPDAQAGADALRRASDIAATDAQLARTHTAQHLLARDGRVVGYRRVLSTKPNHCGLCIVASTQRYHRSDLMPIHPGCGCTVAPIIGSQDPGRTINAAQLAGVPLPQAMNAQGIPVYSGDDTVDLGNVLRPVHQAVAERFGAAYADARGIDYRKVLISHTHGEMGPLLSVVGDRFTGAQKLSGDLAAKPGTFNNRRKR